MAADLSANGSTVLIFNSPGGDSRATHQFLDSVLGEEQTRFLLEGAKVKIYKARGAAALLAFGLGSEWELSANAKILFHLGGITVQRGNPDHFTQDGRIAASIIESWKKYRSAVAELTKRLGLDADPHLQAALWATGELELSAQECLRRGLVSRLF